MILLDYDGTLVGYHQKPDLAIPDESLIQLIEGLLQLPQTEVAIVSGRDQDFLEKWLGHLPMTLVAEHGYFIKHKNQKWAGKEIQQKNWKEDLIPLLESFTDRTPGTFIEEKRKYIQDTYKTLDKAIYGHKEAKTHMLQVIGKWMKNPDSGGNVLAIQGPMGNGKTTLVKEGISTLPIINGKRKNLGVIRKKHLWNIVFKGIPNGFYDDSVIFINFLRLVGH